MKKLLFFLVFSLQIDAFAQLANGTVAPDFTLTDYYGTTHQLYSYLNSGKTVFLEIFAVTVFPSSSAPCKLSTHSFAS